MSATKGTTRKAADDKKSKNDNNKNKKDSKSKMSKDEVEKMLAMKKRNDPKQQSKRSFVDIARGVTKSKPFVRKSSMNDDPVMVKNAQNFVNDTKNSSSVSRSHSDVIMKPNGLFQRSRLSDRQSHSNNDLRVNSRSNSIRHIDSDNERRSRNNSFSRNGSFHRYDDEDDYYPDDVIEEDSRYADKNRRQSSFKAQSPTDRRIGMQSLKILREMGRENNDSIQEQLLDTNSVTAAPSSNVPTKSHDDILHKIKTPFQNQILERRIQTLDADREVLRQLNKSLIEENESLKSFKISRSILSTDKEETPQLSRLKEFTQDIDASKENDISKEINDLKSVVTHLNRLSDFKEKQNTSRIDNAPTLFSHYNSNPCVADSNGIPLQQWDQLREQSKLVLEENQLLMDQKLLYKKTMDDLSSNYQEEVMRLSTQLSEGNRDKNRLEHMLDDRDLELSLLREKYESITDRNENRMEKSEHDTKVERLHKNYMYEVSTLKSEVEKLNNTIEAQNKEKSRLAMQVTDLTATNSRLLMELKIAEKNFRKSEKRVIQCMSELEEIYGKEIVTKGTLAQVLKMAEKTSVEKEQMTLLVEAQKEKTQEALEQIHHDDLTLQDLRRQLKNTKERRKNQFSKIKQRIMDQGQEVSSIVNKYEKELGQLQNVVRQKQRFIDRIQCDKSVTEHRLDEMYNSLNNHSDMKYNQFT